MAVRPVPACAGWQFSRRKSCSLTVTAACGGGGSGVDDDARGCSVQLETQPWKGVCCQDREVSLRVSSRAWTSPLVCTLVRTSMTVELTTNETCSNTPWMERRTSCFFTQSMTTRLGNTMTDVRENGDSSCMHRAEVILTKTASKCTARRSLPVPLPIPSARSLLRRV